MMVCRMHLQYTLILALHKVLETITVATMHCVSQVQNAIVADVPNGHFWKI